MTNQSTIDKLIEMRLSSMADAFRYQLNSVHMPVRYGDSMIISGTFLTDAIMEARLKNP